MTIGLFIVVTAIVVTAYGRNYMQGVICSIFLMLFLPYNICLKMGGLPNLTVHRALVLVMAGYWLFNALVRKSPTGLPAFKSFTAVLLTGLFAAVLSVIPATSIKASLSMIIEWYLLYVIIGTSFMSLQNEDAVMVRTWLCRAIVYAAVAVAILGVIERWTGFNFVNFLPRVSEMPEFLDNLHTYQGRVKATYPHAILLGYGLAMCFPLVLLFARDVTGRFRKWAMYFCFFLVGSCIFFTESRGAWIGAILSAVVLVLAVPSMRKQLFLFGCLLALVLVVRPQVTKSILNLVGSTSNVQSLKGRSANYRMELWIKAYTEVARSPQRFALGYGENSHSYVDWSGYEVRTGRFSHFWSWDNEYAVILLERGVLGLAAFGFLIASVLTAIARQFRRVAPGLRPVFVAMCVPVLVYFFMMTNVKIFSPQIKVLFLVCVAVLGTFDWSYARSDEPVEDKVPVGEGAVL